MLPEIAPAEADLADQRLAGGQHAVGFDPHAADGDEPALVDARLHAREQVGVLGLEPFVLLGGTHRVGEVRVLVHQGEHVGHGAGHLAAGLAHRPQPRRIDVRVADGAHAHRGGVGRPGEHAGELGAGLAHGIGTLLVEGVQRALQRLGELPVTGRLLVGLLHKRRDDVEIDPILLVSAVEFGQVGGAEHIRLLAVAGGPLAEFGPDERGYAEQQRVAGRLQIDGEPSVAVHRGLRVAVGVHEGHPVVERVHRLDGGAVRPVDEPLDMPAAGVLVPAEVEDQLERPALRQALRHAPADAEPCGAPGGAPFAADGERAELDAAGLEAGEELAAGHRLAGDVERFDPAMGQHRVDAGIHALAHDAPAPFELMLWFEKHCCLSFSCCRAARPRRCAAPAWGGSGITACEGAGALSATPASSTKAI